MTGKNINYQIQKEHRSRNLLAWIWCCSNPTGFNSAQPGPTWYWIACKNWAGHHRVKQRCTYHFFNDLIAQGENSQECNSIIRNNVIKGSCLPAVNEIINSFQHAIWKPFLLNVKFRHVLCGNVWDKPQSYSTVNCYLTIADKCCQVVANADWNTGWECDFVFTGRYDKTLAFLFGLYTCQSVFLTELFLKRKKWG